MTAFWKYFFVFLFILAVPVAAYFGYRSYRSLKNPSSPAFNAMSPKTALIVEFREPKAFTKKLTQNTNFWKELTGIESVALLDKYLMQLDSVFGMNTQINEIFEKYKLYVCFHTSSQGKPEPLFIYELPSIGYKFTIENFIREVNGERSIVMQKKYQNVAISKLNIPGLGRLLNFSIHKGVFLGSFEESLVKEAIDQMNSGTPVSQNEQFKRLEISAGKNVDANIYLNYAAFSDLALTLTGKDFKALVQNLAKMGNWSETDLIIKPDEILLTGYTMTSGDGSRLLDLFRQEPQAIEIPEILPYDISVMFHFAFEDFGRYYASRRSYEQQNNLVKAADSIAGELRRKTGADVPQYFFPWIGREAALATSGEVGDTAANRYVIIHATDIKIAADSISRITELLSPSKKAKRFEEEFEDYVIRYLDAPGLFPVLFGPLFKGMNCPYYFTIRDYVVFANSPGAIKYLITNFYVQKTLAVNPNFRSFSNGISDKSNVFFYCNTRKSLSAIANFANPELSEIVRSNSSVIKTFEGIAVQFSYTNEMFYTSIYLRHNPDYEEELPSGWNSELPGKIIGKPALIRNEESGKLNVIVFDDLNNMYLLDHFGKITWKTPLIEMPLSQIYEVDHFKDGKKQFLFNTPNYLYLIDRLGNYVGEYPIRLMATATNGIAVTDYDYKMEYRLTLALSDNRIYNFDIEGKQLAGWEKVSTAQPVNRTIEHLTWEDKDYLFITDENGNVSIVNTKGASRITMKKGFKKAKNTEFYINQTNSKGLFITTDTQGKLVYIDEAGKLDRTDFGDFSGDHYFLYEDISKDDSKDFIYIDQNKLKVYDRFKETILEYEFPGIVTTPPVTFKLRGGEILIGVVAAGKIYFFNQNGEVYKGNNFTGNTPFTTGSINSDGKLNIIIGSGNKLANYLLE
jgi:hypothetical protein